MKSIDIRERWSEVKFARSDKKCIGPSLRAAQFRFQSNDCGAAFRMTKVREHCFGKQYSCKCKKSQALSEAEGTPGMFAQLIMRQGVLTRLLLPWRPSRPVAVKTPILWLVFGRRFNLRLS